MAPTSHLRTHEFVPEVSAGSSRSSHKPKLEFPKFDGQQPRLWKDKCESYFEVYEISDALKPRFAALNFTGLAETWLHTAELRGRFMSWEALHTAVCARFDRDQYHLHLKQLDNLKQTGSVSEYLCRFEQLTHSILLYNTAYDDTYLVTRFLGGLRDDIRAPIALHRPKDVATASSLALLQEEEVDSRIKLPNSRADSKDSGKSGSKVFSTMDKPRSQFKKDDTKKASQSCGG